MKTVKRMKDEETTLLKTKNEHDEYKQNMDAMKSKTKKLQGIKQVPKAVHPRQVCELKH